MEITEEIEFKMAAKAMALLMAKIKSLFYGK
jgi:hypothetical protein